MVTRFFSDPAARSDADEMLARLPIEAPVLDVGEMWLISGYDEICRLNAGGGVRTSPYARNQVVPMSVSPTLATLYALMFPMTDGDDHRRLRGLSSVSFGPKRVSELRRALTECVDDLLASAIQRGSFDVVRDISEVLPTSVAAIQMGTPQEERESVRRWASVGKRYLMNFGLSAAEIDEAEVELQEFIEYVDLLCARRRRDPGDDLVSELVVAADAGRVSNDELVAYVLNMFMNGVDTLSSGLTMAIWEVIDRPDELTRCGEDALYAEAAFGEAVRLHTPVRFGSRFLDDDVELRGKQLQRDAAAVLFYAAANRDPSRFIDPSRFDPTRGSARDLGFGHGPHHCLGQQLSLLTGGIVLQRLGLLGHRLTTDLTRATLPWSDDLPFCTLDSLSVVVTPNGGVGSSPVVAGSDEHH